MCWSFFFSRYRAELFRTKGNQSRRPSCFAPAHTNDRAFMSNIILSDFDETITSVDTISTLAVLPYLYKQFAIPWSHFTDTYAEGFQKFKTSNRTLPILHPWLLDQNKLISAANFDELFYSEISYQDSVRPIELNSVNEMERSGAFRGISLEDVKDFATTKVPLLREDFIPVWKEASEMHIVSINWSQEFIESSLYALASSKALRVSDLPLLHTHCNALQSKDGKLTGEFDKSIVTGADKVRKVQSLLKGFPVGSTVWYVGDSETDLLSALHPGINGVLILDPAANEKKFTKMMTVLGLTPTHIKDYSRNSHAGIAKIPCKENGALYLAKSWKALSKLLK
ncbi:LAQU0S02e02762g1_1 [Lachancea quebecensis]|uniref:LAQU0S02e02762g1_1 n=1 Tax=Lachancea quebecensis TaxID=1654605 RepID=A0A0P1KQF6_9SACH|nr:LAQU0S02e02762g1_1 [Lachancea quebecensis]